MKLAPFFIRVNSGITSVRVLGRIGLSPSPQVGQLSSLNRPPGGLIILRLAAPGPLSSSSGTRRKLVSTFSRPLHSQPASLHHCQSPTQLPLAPATPLRPAALPCLTATPHSWPCRRLAPGHPAPKTIKRKPGDRDSTPPWFICCPRIKSVF